MFVKDHRGLAILVEPPEPEASTKFLAVGAHCLVRLDDGVLFPSIEAAKASLGMQDCHAETEVVEQKVEPIKLAGRRR